LEIVLNQEVNFFVTSPFYQNRTSGRISQRKMLNPPDTPQASFGFGNFGFIIEGFHGAYDCAYDK
jgi:hypothetical protein